MADTRDWQSQYVTFPDNDVYPDDSTFPDNVWRVTGKKDVWSKDGKWRWEKVTDVSSVERVIQTTQALEQTIRSIPTSLDMVVGVAEGQVVNATVVEQLFSRYVTAEQGRFVQIQSGNIAANAIGADHIQAGAIDGTIITGATFRTSASAPRVVMDLAGIRAFDSNNNVTFRMSSVDGSVWSRGNFGTSDSWSEVYFGDVSDTRRTTYAGGWERVYAGCGLRIVPQKLASNTANTVSMSQDGSIFASYRSMTSSDKDNGYKGTATYAGQMGVAIQAPRRTTAGDGWSTLLVEEGGFHYSNYTNDRPFYFSVAPQRFTAYSPKDSGGYRFVVEGGSDACIQVWTNETSTRNIWWYLGVNDWNIRNKSYAIEASSGMYQLALATGVDHSSTSSMNKTHVVLGGGGGDGWCFFIENGGRQKIYIARNAYSALSLNKGTIQLRATSGSNGMWINTSQQWCAGIKKNFVMQVPEITRRSGMQLVHSSTESPANGIEYWKTATLNEDGFFRWQLPEYIALIASSLVDKSVFVTCSTGTAAAWLEEDGTQWYIDVTEGTPGATVNILLKLGRILDVLPQNDKDVYAERWYDDGYNNWVPLGTREEMDHLLSGYGPELPLPGDDGEPVESVTAPTETVSI